MSAIAIRGTARTIGLRIGQLFAAEAEVSQVVGVDPAAPDKGFDKLLPGPHPDGALGEVFTQHQVERALFIGRSLSSGRLEEASGELQALEHFLQACSTANVKLVALLSSASVYGLHPDNALPLWEGSPLRPAPTFPLSEAVLTHERRLATFARDHPEARVQILRTAPMVGGEDPHPLETLTARPTIYALKGSDPPIQLIHLDDVAGATFRLLKTGALGVFNLAADETLTMAEMAHMHRKRIVRLPELALRVMFRMGWSFGWKGLGRIPPETIQFMKAPLVVSNRKLKQEVLYRFKYSTRGAFLDLLETEDPVV